MCQRFISRSSWISGFETALKLGQNPFRRNLIWRDIAVKLGASAIIRARRWPSSFLVAPAVHRSFKEL